MARLSGLGKGLGALIPADAKDGGGGSDTPRLLDIPVGSIVPNPNQPRVHFDEESLSELANSIREIGVLQPVLVRRTVSPVEKSKPPSAVLRTCSPILNCSVPSGLSSTEIPFEHIATAEAR